VATTQCADMNSSRRKPSPSTSTRSEHDGPLSGCSSPWLYSPLRRAGQLSQPIPTPRHAWRLSMPGADCIADRSRVPSAKPRRLLSRWRRQPRADPVSLLGFLFTPIFQGFSCFWWGSTPDGQHPGCDHPDDDHDQAGYGQALGPPDPFSEENADLGPKLRELTKELNRRYKGDRMAIRRPPRSLQGARRQARRPMPAVSAADGPPLPDYWSFGTPHQLRPERNVQVFGVNLIPSITSPPICWPMASPT